MIEIDRILAPIDFSEVSTPAFVYAAALARWYRARVTALHVFVNRPPVNIVPSPHPSGFAPIALDAVTDDIVRHLDGVIEQAGASDVAVDRMVRDAPDAPEEILAQAALLPADLLVIGTHGRGGFDHLVLGSVAEKVLRKAQCPVLIVPKQAHQAPRNAPVQFRRILCAVDFSEASIASLEYAMSLAEEADARLTLLHAIEVPHGIREEPWNLDVDAIRAGLETEGTRRLEALVPEAVRTFCTVETVVTEGKASREILRLAKARESDVIVMGVHGRGALDLVIFGSNTHAVIRHADCPVLTVRR
jgi:nucleotide-binding universal stress UspA family protein